MDELFTYAFYMQKQVYRPSTFRSSINTLKALGKRVNLLKQAAVKTHHQRSGYKGEIETLIMDESLGTVDEEGRQATIEILRQLPQRFKKILVISHVDDVKEAFDTKLVVSKDANARATDQ